MELAIAEPHFYGIHGGASSIPHYMVLYSYDREEFYNNVWQDDYKESFRQIRSFIHQTPHAHDLIRTYKYHMDKHIRLQLVKTYQDEQGRSLCSLHTYKLNLFKRLWRKHRSQRQV